jgi:DMSO/TMAO reductase YedYZ molybdopterin-dependent catalytic subunit
MMIPGVYGMKQAKWITRVELIDRAYLGYWESQGWSNTAVVRVNSGITMPEEEQALPQGFAILRGFAFADESGITGVDVSTDGGRTWQPCELLPGPTTRVWSMWRYRWAIPGPGKYRLVARATDGHGVTQAIEAFSILNGTFPNGTSAAHSISVTVGS